MFPFQGRTLSDVTHGERLSHPEEGREDVVPGSREPSLGLWFGRKCTPQATRPRLPFLLTPGTFARGTLSRPGPFLSGSVARVLVWSYPVTERALPGEGARDSLAGMCLSPIRRSWLVPRFQVRGGSSEAQGQQAQV